MIQLNGNATACIMCWLVVVHWLCPEPEGNPLMPWQPEVCRANLKRKTCSVTRWPSGTRCKEAICIKNYRTKKFLFFQLFFFIRYNRLHPWAPCLFWGIFFSCWSIFIFTKKFSLVFLTLTVRECSGTWPGHRAVFLGKTHTYILR